MNECFSHTKTEKGSFKCVVRGSEFVSNLLFVSLHWPFLLNGCRRGGWGGGGGVGRICKLDLCWFSPESKHPLCSATHRYQSVIMLCARCLLIERGFLRTFCQFCQSSWDVSVCHIIIMWPRDTQVPLAVKSSARATRRAVVFPPDYHHTRRRTTLRSQMIESLSVAVRKMSGWMNVRLKASRPLCFSTPRSSLKLWH